jgi:hypothetical protein
MMHYFMAHGVDPLVEEAVNRAYASDGDYEVSWQDVWSQPTTTEILRTVHDVPMVGQLGHEG